MALRLYLLRHAETAASLSGQYIGSGSDVSLTDNGLNMASKFAVHYSQIPWRAIYASPALRVRQTVGPLVQKVALEVNYREGLREINYGQWEGKSAEEIKQSAPQDYRSFMEDGERFAPPGGETVREVMQRSSAVVEEIRENVSEGDVLVASHRTTLRVLLCAFFNIELRRYREIFEYTVCSISVVEFRVGKPLLIQHGNQSHLVG